MMLHMKQEPERESEIPASELTRGAAGRRGAAVMKFRLASKPAAKVKLPDMSRYRRSFPKVPADSGRYLEEDR